MAHTAAVAAAVNRVSSAAQHAAPLAPTPKRPPATEGTGKLLKVDSIAEIFRSDIQRSISASTVQPIKLVGILASGSLANKPSEVYAEFTRKQCEALGVEYVLKKVGGIEGEGHGAIEDAIIEVNRDQSVHGILVNVPTYTQLSKLNHSTSTLPRCITPSSEDYKIIICNKYGKPPRNPYASHPISMHLTDTDS